MEAAEDRKMNRQMAEYLVDCFIGQFEQVPFHRHIKRMKISQEQREKLVSIIEKTPAWNHPERMQFKVPGTEAETSVYDNEKLAAQIIRPRRVFTNYDRAIKKSVIERTVSDLTQGIYDRGKSTFASEVICRELRDEPRITQMRTRSMEAGNPYSLMIHLYVAMRIASHGGGGETPIHVPLFIIPGASKEDLETLSVYSMWHQHQRPEVVTYLRHGVFNSEIDDRYFECLEKFNAKSESVKKELDELEHGKGNEARIKELRDSKIPFLCA